MTPDDLFGRWKITAMDVWAQDYVDLVVPDFIAFEREDAHLLGEFQFGTVVGWMDCRIRAVGPNTWVEWSWQGRNDRDQGCGRGWARIDNGRLIGHLYIHAGDDSAFVAERAPSGVTRSRRPAATRRR